LDGEQIRKATSNDSYILGVISAKPTVIGDAWGLGWRDMYIRDEWGEIICDKDETPKINPDYDPDREYIPREERPEWAAVGMMGKITVRDDGSCQVDGFCRPNDGGIATASESGYRVMKRLDENRVYILLHSPIV